MLDAEDGEELGVMGGEEDVEGREEAKPKVIWTGVDLIPNPLHSTPLHSKYITGGRGQSPITLPL